MATGDTLLILNPQSASPPNAGAAQFGTMTGANAATAKEILPTIDFDGGSADEHMDWCDLWMPSHYGGGGLTVTIVWGAATSTGANKVMWDVALRAVDAGGEDQDTTAHTYSYQNANPTEPGTVGIVLYTTVALTAGAQMDSVVKNSMFHLRLRRRASDTTNDTMTGDARVQCVVLAET